MRLKDWLAVLFLTVASSHMSVLGAVEEESIDALSFTAPYSYPELQWKDDFEEAKKVSIKENKPLFILFEGSDWCANCREFNQEILTKPSFVAKMQDHFVFLKVDFPLHYRLPPEKCCSNQALKKQFQVEGFPTVVILLPTGGSMRFAGNFPKGADESAAMFLKESGKAIHLDEVMTHLDSSELSASDLEMLYAQAKQLDRADYVAVLLHAGIQAPENAFFLREQYRDLIAKGEMNSTEAEKVRDALITKDPDNSKGHHLFLAVLEFQSLAKINAHKREINTVSSPLHSYLEGVGNQDDENKWKVQLMLAHFFCTMGDSQKAVEYAQSALAKAPEHIRPEIETSIQKMSGTANAAHITVHNTP